MIIKTVKFYVGSREKLNLIERWFNYSNCAEAKTMEEADFVVFHGTSNISPEYINEEGASYNKISIIDPRACKYELENLEKAVSLKKPILAIEKGMHLVNVFLGGRMVSHMQHPFVHKITNYDGSVLRVPSRHNQIIKPYTIPSDKYKVISYSESLSPIYLNSFSQNTILKTNSRNKSEEIESIYFKEINALGIQYNPSLAPKNSGIYTLANKLVKLLLGGKLGGVLELSIPLDMIDPYTFNFNEEELRRLELLKVKIEENVFSN